MKMINPESWPRPSGYNNGVISAGKILFIAGQIGWNKQGKLVADDLVTQVKQALSNVVAVLKEAGAEPGHVCRLTWYVTNIEEYRERAKEIGEVYRSVFGKHYAAMSLLGVNQLLERGAVVEIEATAVLPTE